MGGYCLLVQKMQIKKKTKIFNSGILGFSTFYLVGDAASSGEEILLLLQVKAHQRVLAV